MWLCKTEMKHSGRCEVSMEFLYKTCRCIYFVGVHIFLSYINTINKKLFLVGNINCRDHLFILKKIEIVEVYLKKCMKIKKYQLSDARLN